MAYNLLMTGGDWWSRPTTKNLGQQFLIQLIRNSRSSGTSSSRPPSPINVYICTRRPPPARELELFILRHSSLDSGWFPSAPSSENSSTNNNDDVLDRIKMYHLPLDLTSPASIQACARSFLDKEKKLDYLLLNAAVAPKARKTTSVELQGELVEEALMTNVLGHALLTEKLRSRFHQRGSGQSTRVVTVSSELHRRMQETVSPGTLPDLLGETNWDGMRAYKVSKLIQTHYAYALREIMPECQLESVAVSPGFVPSTNLSQNSPKLAQIFMQYLLHYAPFASTPEEGGKKLYEACFGDNASSELQDGAVYLKDGQVVRAAEGIYDQDLHQEWIEWTRRSVTELEMISEDI